MDLQKPMGRILFLATVIGGAAVGGIAGYLLGGVGVGIFCGLMVGGGSGLGYWLPSRV